MYEKNRQLNPMLQKYIGGYDEYLNWFINWLQTCSASIFPFTTFITSIVQSSCPSWPWSYGSLIFNFLCNQCILSLKLWVRTPFMARCTRYNIMWSSLSVTYDRSVVFTGYSGFLH